MNEPTELMIGLYPVFLCCISSLLEEDLKGTVLACIGASTVLTVPFFMDHYGMISLIIAFIFSLHGVCLFHGRRRNFRVDNKKFIEKENSRNYDRNHIDVGQYLLLHIYFLFGIFFCIQCSQSFLIVTQIPVIPYVGYRNPAKYDGISARNALSVRYSKGPSVTQNITSAACSIWYCIPYFCFTSRFTSGFPYFGSPTMLHPRWDRCALI